MKKWEKVGVIGVDAGLCWLGDPSYLAKPEISPLGNGWRDFCEKLEGKEESGTSQWQHQLGHDGLGVCVSTGFGDGTYPVYVRRDPFGNVAAVKVVFIPSRNK